MDQKEREKVTVSVLFMIRLQTFSMQTVGCELCRQTYQLHAQMDACMVICCQYMQMVLVADYGLCI